MKKLYATVKLIIKTMSQASEYESRAYYLASKTARR